MKDQVAASRPASCGDRLPTHSTGCGEFVVIGHPPEEGPASPNAQGDSNIAAIQS